MRTGLFLLAGFLLLGAAAVLARLFAHNYPSAPAVATGAFLLLFDIPAALAVVLKWKVL